MAKNFRVSLCWLLAACLTGTLAAQQPALSTVPAAPVPAQILAGKKVFVSNVPGALSFYPRNAEDDPNRPYNQFYAELKNWGYYELVPAPADADLILEISLSNERMMSSASQQVPVHQAHFDLTVRDPKTQVVLWWLAERLEGANRAATGEKNYHQAMTNLVNDLKKLVGQPATPSGDTKK
jgi:hypothetical protein